MKIQEIIEELSNILDDMSYDISNLYEQALGRKEVKSKICDLSDNIMDHLCKILYLKVEMPSTLHHWYAEILAHVNKIIALQLKGGHLKEATLVEWLRNGLTNPNEMDNRRTLVAIQEDIDADKLAPLQDTDYVAIIEQVQNLAKLILASRVSKRKPTIEDIEYICLN